MTHTELMKLIAQKMALKDQEAAILWRETEAILVDQLKAEDKIRIKNFGAFVMITHKSRTVPDPRQTNKKLIIFENNLPKFRPSEQLRAMVKAVIPRALEEIKDQEPKSKNNKALLTDQKTETQDANNQEPRRKKAADQPTARGSNIDYINLEDLTIDKAILNAVPYHVAKKYQIAPVEQQADSLVVAMIDPGDREAIDLVTRQTGLKVIPRLTTEVDLQHALDQYGDMAADLNGSNDEEEKETVVGPSDDESEVNDAPAAKLVTRLLERAVREKASDIHIEPEEKTVTVRFRIYGILEKVIDIPKKLQASVISRLKIMSDLKIDESRLPQDGRLRMLIDQNSIDFRLSTLPTVNGEKIVMRILDKSAGILSFKELGLDGENLRRIEDNITKSHGMILVTGPTGSGKSTTLYAVISKIMKPAINIVTLEDPVEYRISGINQSQVNGPIGFDFASGLRSIVRQDPDVILIGEIRDLETATMAIQSALTGHIVLSTLHTNDAAGAIPRLIDMGIEPFLITSSTNAVLGQRLVRRICEHCKEKVSLPDEALVETRAEIDKMPSSVKPKLGKLTFYKGKGCSQCNNTGYKGREGIFEVLPVTESIKQLAFKRVSGSDITAQAIKEGMVTMKQDGIIKALAGTTTLEEVWRVTRD